MSGSLAGVSICNNTACSPLSLMGRTLMTVKSPVDAKTGKRVGDLFSAFVDLMESDEGLHSCYQKLADRWRLDKEKRAYYGGFFKNYYRNREGVDGYDEKVMWQASLDFLDEFERQLASQAYKKSSVCDLITETKSVLLSSIALLRPTICKICARHPELRSRLLVSWSEPPCVIRIMRYRRDGNMATNPHVDKSVLTSIVWNSDDASSQKLAFKPNDSVSENVSEFAALGGEPGNAPAYLFWGAALREAGYKQYRPTPHAVLPMGACERYRYSIAVFWLLPGLDLSSFSTKTAFANDNGLARTAA